MNPILCPLLNALPLTMKAHETFIAQSIPVDILYINNGSTDNTANWLNSIGMPTITFGNPRSVAAAWNRGLKYWFDAGAEHVLVVNNDVELRPDTYEWLLKSGHRFVTAVGSDDPQCSKPPYKAPNLDDLRPHPDFSCFLMHKDVWEKVGPFDESYVGAYVEDANYHVRMHWAGIQAVCIPLGFYHVASGTLKHADEATTERIQKMAEANRRRFREKHGVEVGSDGYYALFGHGKPETT